MKLTKSPHEYDFYALKHFTPQPGEIYVDVGVNRGSAILSMLLFSGKKTPIIGFEPNPFLVEFLSGKKFIESNGVLLKNIGLADKNGSLKLYIPFYRNWMFDGLSSFHYESAKNWLVERMWRFNYSNLTIKEAVCKVNCLDEFNLNPYFIKIDVQGFELNVL